MEQNIETGDYLHLADKYGGKTPAQIVWEGELRGIMVLQNNAS